MEKVENVTMKPISLYVNPKINNNFLKKKTLTDAEGLSCCLWAPFYPCLIM